MKKLIVGLGNPGVKYQDTRHNLGFTVLDHLLHKLQPEGHHLSWIKEDKFKSEVVKLSFPNDQRLSTLILAKPLTYMNNSGLAVSLLTRFLKILPQDLIVVYDELDLPLGQIKIRFGGSASGHHGVESIIQHLNTDQFIRVRLGISPLKGSGLGFLGEHKKMSFNAEHFVLEPFIPQERPKVRSMIKKAVKAIEILLKEGLARAQNQFN